MRPTGFSTGALTKGDFREALTWINSTTCDAIELSALRQDELVPLLDALADLDLSGFKYKAIHAPKDYSEAQEQHVADALMSVGELGFRIVLHPDSIFDTDVWRPFGSMLCIENMDISKKSGRTPEELHEIFDKLPEAGLCFDLGHARQVDPSMATAFAIIDEFKDRVAHIHVSEVDASGAHWAMSQLCLMAFEQLTMQLGTTVAVIIESQVGRDRMANELSRTRHTLSNNVNA